MGEHYPLENCDKNEHVNIEKRRIVELDCNMNDGGSWFVEHFEELSKTIT